MSRHYCPRCHYNTSVKIGTTSSGRQRYRCEKCYKTWTNKPRPDRFCELVWHDYLWNNLTSTMLAKKYHVCKRTIDTVVENYEVPSIIPPNNYPATVVCMDVIYTHRKTRTLIKGIAVLLPYLFTFEQYPEFNIPKTNNLIEGVHSALKNKLNIHRGATKSLKTKIVFSFLSGRTGV